jgi:hypothetical protein
MKTPRKGKNMTRKNATTARKTQKAQKTPTQKVRKGRNESKPVYGILPPDKHRRLIATKKTVVIPPPDTGIVEVDDVWINNKFQRNLLQNGIDDLIACYKGMSLQEAAEAFRDGCGFTLSALRKDGLISKIDGQRRVALAKYLKDFYGVGTWFIPTEVVKSKGNSHEASMFKDRNHRKKLSYCEAFKGRLISGNATENGIDAVLDKFGLAVKGVDKFHNTKRITCVGSLYKAFAVDNTGRHLEDVISTIKNAWGSSMLPKVQKEMYNGTAIEPVSIFLRKNPATNLAEMSRKLSRYTPEQVAAMAPSVLVSKGYTRNQAIADHGIATIYASPLKRRSI